MIELLTLCEAVEAVTGRRPHLSTIIRWSTRGIQGVRLGTTILGGRRLTSVAAVEQFLRETNEARQGDTEPFATPRQQEQAAERSAEQLRKRLANKGSKR
jgi:hypothetical protein